jgi:hypothetical protein
MHNTAHWLHASAAEVSGEWLVVGQWLAASGQLASLTTGH